ncbi:MAG: methyltransferase domain-containing protein [Candidatus Paceibacterota bacterium]|jgi:hypothetical protein
MNQEKKFTIQNYDLNNTSKEEYTDYYKKYESDSPSESRNSMAKKIRELIQNNMILPKKILNIGSGVLTLEKELMYSHIQKKDRSKILKEYDFVSIDLAKISSIKLFDKKRKDFLHTQANAIELPFKNKTFGLVVSNHAIDFAPHEPSFKEAFRVLNNNSNAIFYFHHPSLLEQSDGKDRSVMILWKYLKENSMLFENENEIKNSLKNAGFSSISVNLNSNKSKSSLWWEVVAKKI